MAVSCSLTGVDARTDLGRLSALAAEHPNVEFAILLSNTRAGHENRYPEFQIIEQLSRRAERDGIQVALHLCGAAVPEFVFGKGAAAALAQSFGRVQLNFVMARVPFDAAELDDAIGRFGGRIITQHNKANANLWSEIASTNHEVLFDASGGRGISPDRWPMPLTGKRCGYAGGISPANVDDVLDSLSGIMEPDGWIDMESSLRNDRDDFDLDRCEAVLQAVHMRSFGVTA